MASSRALSSFVAIAKGNLESPTRVRLRIQLAMLCAVLWLIGLLPSPLRNVILGFAAVLTFILIVDHFVHPDSPETDAGSVSVDRWKLLDRMNRIRASHGLQALISESALQGLEENAALWEQIESMLQSSLWNGQPELRARVQRHADEYMTQMVIRYGAGPNDERVLNLSRCLRELLEAVHALDQAFFVYPRKSELQANVPLPDLPEVARLEEVLAT